MKWLRLLLIATAFYGGCRMTIEPTRDSAERRWSRPVSEQDSDRLPVLVRVAGAPHAYRILLRREITDETLVTDLDGIDEVEVNRQIAETLSLGPTPYQWFEVLEKGDGWSDVRVESPTRSDRRHRVWYRMQDGTLIPQRELLVTAMGIFIYLFPYPFLAGCLSALVVAWLTRRLPLRGPGRT